MELLYRIRHFTSCVYQSSISILSCIPVMSIYYTVFDTGQCFYSYICSMVHVADIILTHNILRNDLCNIPTLQRVEMDNPRICLTFDISIQILTTNCLSAKQMTCIGQLFSIPNIYLKYKLLWDIHALCVIRHGCTVKLSSNKNVARSVSVQQVAMSANNGVFQEVI